MEITSKQVISLLFVDDHAMFWEGLARVLEIESGLEVVGQFGSSSEALTALNESGATLDVDLGQERALEFVLEYRKRGLKGQVLWRTPSAPGALC